MTTSGILVSSCANVQRGLRGGSRTMRLLFTLHCLLAFLGAQAPEPVTDSIDPVIHDVDAVRFFSPKYPELEIRRKKVLSNPAWQEITWAYVSKLARQAELLDAEYQAYLQRRKQLFALMRATEGSASVPYGNELQRLGLELGKRFDATARLAGILNGIGSLNSEEAIALIAPLLDSEGVALWRGDSGMESVSDLAVSALLRLKRSGVKFPGRVEFEGPSPQWQKWWGEVKPLYRRFRFDGPSKELHPDKSILLFRITLLQKDLSEALDQLRNII